MFQGLAGSAVQFHFGFLIRRLRADQIQFRQCEIALGGEGLIGRPRAEFLLFLCDIKRPLSQIPRLARGLNAGSGLVQRILRVVYFDAHLLLKLLQTQLGLAIFKFRSVLIRFRDSISYRDVQVQAKEVIG